MSIRRIFNLALEKHTCAIAYRFGFNTQERDDEIAGFGNIMTAEYWEYDTRLGRRWNVDPEIIQQPWMSSYQTFSNRPTVMIDPNGDLETRYEDEKGTELANTNDGNTSTVTVKNDQRAKFDKWNKDSKKSGNLNDPQNNMKIINEITPPSQGLYFSSIAYGRAFMRYRSDHNNNTEIFGYSTTNKGMIVLPFKGVNSSGEPFENYSHGSDPTALPMKGNLITLGKKTYHVKDSYHTHPNNSYFSGFPLEIKMNGKSHMVPGECVFGCDRAAYEGDWFTKTNNITTHYVIGKTKLWMIKYDAQKRSFGNIYQIK